MHVNALEKRRDPLKFWLIWLICLVILSDLPESSTTAPKDPAISSEAQGMAVRGAASNPFVNKKMTPVSPVVLEDW